MKIDRYQAYKDSEVEWLGDVPEHWNCELIKRSLQVLTDYTANGSFASLAENVTYQESGYARLVRLTDLRHDLTNDGLYVDKNAYNFLSKTKINGGEILIANVGAYTGLVKLVPKINFKATLGPNMFLAVFNNKLFKRFITYHLGSIGCFEQFRVQMTATAQPKLNKDNFRSISIVIPPLSEQKANAHYLDTKTAQIDRKIDLLTQKATQYGNLKQSLINEAVTRGLDRSVVMKDSRIEWLGEVPKHWEIKHFKQFSTMKGRIGWQGLKHSEFIDEGPFLITGMNFKGGKINWNEVYHITNERYEQAPEIQLKTNDILMTKDGTIGKLLYVDNIPAPHTASLNSHLLVFRPIQKSYHPRYLYYQLDSSAFQDYVEVAKAGTTFFGISQAAVGRYIGILPPLSEQKAIADYLDTKTTQIDQIIRTINTQIEKLKELRKPLINDVVTGKIKVA